MFTNILRYFIRDETKEGIDNTPIMLFFVQTVLTVIFSILIICGELFMPAILMCYFPLLASRSGRGCLIIMTALPTIGPHFGVVVLILLFLIIGALNVWIGW